MFKEEIEKKLKKIAPEDVKVTVSSVVAGVYGDYSTNLPFLLAKKEGSNPADVAEKFSAVLVEDKKFTGIVSSQAVAGFINFCLSDKSLNEGLAQILKKENWYGTSDIGRGQKINIEFVSANPTGPLTLGNGRSASSVKAWLGFWLFLIIKLPRNIMSTTSGGR